MDYLPKRCGRAYCVWSLPGGSRGRRACLRITQQSGDRRCIRPARRAEAESELGEHCRVPSSVSFCLSDQLEQPLACEFVRAEAGRESEYAAAGMGRELIQSTATQ
jgi:hypothetical protein